MKYLTIQIEKSISEEEAQYLLESEKLTFLYSTQEKGVLEIATSWIHPFEQLKQKYPWILAIHEKQYDQVDWNDQWEIHGDNYENGLLEVDLTPYGNARSFKMKPGPGFGDLSHQTTRLTMELMLPLSNEKHVVDIGCGSGVLSLAAVASGAKKVYALDIAPQAIEHTRSNAVLNHFETTISYELAHKPSSEENWLLVMNMIRSEQAIAWNSVKSHFAKVPYDIITSGILESEKDLYLEETKKRGWQLVNEIQDGQWVAFHFSTSLS